VEIEGAPPIFFPEARGRRDAFTKTKFRSEAQTRQPKGLSEMAEELDVEDQAIRERMRTARVTVDLQNAPMAAIVDQLRSTTGLNIVSPPTNTPDAEVLTVKVKDQSIDQALRQMLEPRGKTYEVRNGVVVIVPLVPKEELLSCVATMAVTVAEVSEDGTRVRLNGSVAVAGQVCAVTRGGKFVALIRAGESEATLMKDLSVGRILPGDRVQQVTNLRGFLTALPLEVRQDLASRASQQAIRAKMGLKE
jgi:hypothetical protein